MRKICWFNGGKKNLKNISLTTSIKESKLWQTKHAMKTKILIVFILICFKGFLYKILLIFMKGLLISLV